MSQLLFELGCEELPASFVRRAYEQLADEIVSRLDEAGISHGKSTSMGTPRRLIVVVEDVVDRQPDRTAAVRGPSLKAAFDSEGNPSPALQGFCRGQGVEPGEIRNDGEYVWADKHLPGRETRELLAEILPAAVRSLTFEKSMRWGSARMRFARPIRWMLAAFGGSLVDFEIEGVRSSLESRGHRFNHPACFTATSFESLLSELRARNVEPDPTIREIRIRDGASAATKDQVQLSEELVDENVFLTEWPSAVAGRFREEFLKLPQPVLVTAMAKHERMFPVKDSSGMVTNEFVAIRNAGVDEVVRDGNAWVLNARFNDAKFFYDEDSKLSMSDFLERTSRMSFQEKLGTVRQRADRLSALAVEVARHSEADDSERSFAERAALYAKADLSSGLVSELPALQGVIGGEYARRDNFEDPVCWAIATHYDLSQNPSPNCAGARTAVRVLIADQLDKLAGYLGIGLAPTGSSDPFGLRRAVTMLIEAAWAWKQPLPSFLGLFESALQKYERQGFDLDHAAAIRHLAEIFSSRYEAMLVGARHDQLAAAMLPEPGQLMLPRLVRMRLRAIESVGGDIAFIRAMTRPLNIVSAADKKGESFERVEPLNKLDMEAMASAEGRRLAEELSNIREGLSAAVRLEDAEGLVTILRRLEGPINEFFDSTMVMADDPAIRYARLTLLEACRHEILLAGDFSKIVIDGLPASR